MIRLKKLAEEVNGHLVGEGNTPITGVAGIKEAKKGEISFLTNVSYQKYLKDTKASAVIVGENTNVQDIGNLNAIIVKNPPLAYAIVADLFNTRTHKQTVGRSRLAFIAKGAKISKTASIAPFVHIEDGVVIKKNVTIFPFVYIGRNSTVGDGTQIFPNVTIYEGVKIGRNVIVHSGTVIGSDGFAYTWDGSKHVKIPQLGSVEIEDEVEIGSNVTIDRASLEKTIIKKGVKIDNLVQIAHNVTIGENSIIVAQVGIAGSATIGKNVVLAGQAGVRDHVIVGDNVQAGGQTGITKDVPANSLIMGTPHLPFKEWAKLQGYFKMLPQLFAKMKQVEKKLNLEGEDD
ncbi:MAG TPA: UDP-3-O-(3-hydroxymyristoyl)glucosamine N-acyltransferase [Syntrophorhabdus sp.]|nr:MAG: UDP-3-O-acylglucosamine N-acyltransferase [Deltaproteobacteria bacterium ADurb.Bin135]HPB38401.1 UDP-3-O-(3-hydroxymyristoyl)glucosamine N-acyltransferase [Syntrophorhabdus sp.]HPW35216.1 UDP-3-O-(3-hydroxymyristoyl)glucosamine N-acyltransferase [Syntrophorhabdus sp.]HQB33274.1 UDP-3-O-(3-hydroxymyristoyl)glucosamine N-acyltransferase [Syntrophorhabdus sp.]HQP54608.1 UDP-3-O-(3-hydroxymyristoyl)glucosamine N-acyltransferase [Syntrophorhabdus sp.]